MASNPWAEMWSAGDWPVLVAFVALFCGLLYLVSSRWRVMDPSYRGFVGTMMGFWAFYIHRNDSYRLLSFFKQYSLLFAGCVLVSSALALILYARGDHDDTWQPARQPARRQVGGSPPVSP